MKIHRQGTYKTGFKYYKKNIEITDEKEIDKIKALKIPPAYENVTIINTKKIIAFGYDTKGRKQVLYNPKFIKKQTDKKYERVKASIKHFSKMKKVVAKDIKGGDQKKKVIAIIITLILTCGFRIGNKKYEKENNSVGLTTLKYSHVTIEGDSIIIDFIGKKGVRNTSKCNNKVIIDFILSNKKTSKSDDYIFRYGEPIRPITSNDVNIYLENMTRTKSGKGGDLKITTKDLRTWNANTLFMKYFKAIKNLPSAKSGAKSNGKAVRIKDPIKKAIEMTAEKLHNSYAICKKSYIDPNIVELAEKELMANK
jgi:DNA topoisomerase I